MSDGLMLLENILQSVYTGLIVGCIYGLMCVGLALMVVATWGRRSCSTWWAKNKWRA